ncbi:MAG TPA: choice-of-anchor Q domain-containing protein [Pyrinomonadaceae bacterium]|nr:choice-of-anchor Q domain-containing protein [Pyrinomonadaceae bacterium]
MKTIILFCSSLLFVASIASQAMGGTYNVADGDVSALIAAINASNANVGPDTINLAEGGTYTLTYIAGPDSFHGPSGLPIVQGFSATQREFLTINGNGSTIHRSDAPGIPEFRIFHALYANVILDSVVIKGGRGYGARCGGGGLYLNVSSTVIRNSTVTDNFGVEGGGICNNNASTLTIENSTISHNTGSGGEILNHAASLSISNTTIYDDQADPNRSDSIVDAFSPPGSIVIKNSIVARRTGGAGINCLGFTPVSLGHNIFSDSTCGQNVPAGDLVIPSIQLGPLTDNGGLTPTRALTAGHPAVDAISVGDCTTITGDSIATDQRGTLRPAGLGCDIGAFELNDTSPPNITPTVDGILGNGGWYKGDVSVSWNTEDAESPITSQTGCNAVTVTTDTNGTTFTCSATSAGGTSNQSVTIKRDATAPVINVAAPTNGTYLLNQSVNIDFVCSDSASGVASCAGSAPNGSALVTGSPGAKSFTVDATDAAGNAAQMAITYTVVFGVAASFDQTKAHKSGSTVPIKVRLLDANGTNVSSMGIVVHAISVVQTSSQAATSLDDSGKSNPDFDFRYDAAIGGYSFNLKTSGYGTGTYLLNFVAGNNLASYSVGFQVRE